MSSVWNSCLVEAAEARICYHMSIGSSREFMWRKAKAAVQAVAKDIRRLPSGRIVNMPRLREQTAQQELEAIIRGEKLAVPPEMVECLQVPPDRDFHQHPYLRRMEYRGGGYAILMAFELRKRQPNMRQFMYKSEIIKDAQQFCDISMVSTDGWLRSSVCGWASHRSLLQHRLLIAGRNVAQGCSRNDQGEEFSLSEDGHSFLKVMLQKWPFQEGFSAFSSADAQPRIRPRKRWKSTVLSMGADSVIEAPTPLRVKPIVPIALTGGSTALTSSSHSYEAQSPRASRGARDGGDGSASGQRKRARLQTKDIDKDADLAIEISSNDGTDHCQETDTESECDQTNGPLSILVDDRERLRDTAPRFFLERLTVALNLGAHVSRQRLKLGDFAWMLKSLPADKSSSSVMSNVIVERKRISDLVGRSAIGAHAQQLHRLEFCSLDHPYLLIEGDPSQAANCTVYDEIALADSHSHPHRIQSKEDIDDLCAHLLVRQSKIRVVMTRDAEATVRVLAELTEWLGWASSADSSLIQSFFSELGLHDLEAHDSEYQVVQRELTSALLRTGVPAAAVEHFRAAYPSIRHACDAVRSCTSPAHRLHFFDCVPECADYGERICGTLGIDVPAVSTASRISARQVHIGATLAMKKRILTLGVPSYVVAKDAPEMSTGSCCAEISVCADLREQSRLTTLYSEKIFVAVVPGNLLVEAVLEQVERLGVAGRAPEIATEAARIVTRGLLGGSDGGSCSTRLMIIEGLRSAVLHEARRSHHPEPYNQQSILPKLLKLVELASFVLDLSCGWRVRVHERNSTAATSNFLRAVIVAAHERMSLPYADRPEES